VRSYGRSITCIAKHDKEAAQFMGLLLYYAGILQAYSKGNKPSDIHVTSEGLEVKFHCWYLKECNQEFVTFQLEAFYVKRVSNYKLDISVLGVPIKLSLITYSQIGCSVHLNIAILLEILQF
jgi:hypothetical protein